MSKLGLDRGYHKVFAIGFNKTATTSIDAVFRECELASIHNRDWRDTSNSFIHWPFQAFSDGPPDNFVRLDQRFPNSRYILNTRDLSEWLDSRLAHIQSRRAEGKHTDIDVRDRSDVAVAAWIRERNRHHSAVLRHFRNRPQDLLVINYIRDASAHLRIAAFVGSTRRVNRSHTHTMQTGRLQGELRNRELIEGVLTSLDIPRSDWNNDLLCPGLGEVEGLPTDTRELVG